VGSSELQLGFCPRATRARATFLLICADESGPGRIGPNARRFLKSRILPRPSAFLPQSAARFGEHFSMNTAMVMFARWAYRRMTPLRSAVFRHIGEGLAQRHHEWIEFNSFALQNISPDIGRRAPKICPRSSLSRADKSASPRISTADFERYISPPRQLKFLRETNNLAGRFSEVDNG